MDLNEAKQTVSGAERVTLLPDIRAALADRHGSAPQRAMLAQIAMDEIEHGLGELAKLGERFQLMPEPPPPEAKQASTVAGAGAKKG